LKPALYRFGKRRVVRSLRYVTIGKDQRVDFSNPVNVKNIITRVTGNEASKIDGILSVNGGANFFLLNPHGISFGSGARLNMQGTFVGSTASELKFKEGGVYSTTAPQAPLLTMTTPMGLQFGSNPGSIDLSNSKNLVVRDETTKYAGSSVVLVGGNITLDQSMIALPGGKIELVSIGNQGTAKIDFLNLSHPRELSVTVPKGEVRSDISIGNGSRLNSGVFEVTNDVLSGHISLQGQNIKIFGPDKNNSVIFAGSSFNKGEDLGGSIFLNATNNLIFEGDYSGASTAPRKLSKGAGGSIIVDAQNLDILNGAFLVTHPLSGSLGKGGDINITVSDQVMIGAPRNGAESDILARTYGSGDGGNIILKTRKLFMQDGAQIATDNVGTSDISKAGALGYIKIFASESVAISGISSTVKEYGFFSPTAITSNAAGAKNSGDISVSTPRFLLQNGAVISAGTDQSGKGGSIEITGLDGKRAESVELVGNSDISKALKIDKLPGFDGIGNGSRIRSITSNNGSAGNVKIKADLVTLKGGTRIDVSTRGRGNGGSIDIQAKTLKLLDGGQLISTNDSDAIGQEKLARISVDLMIIEGKDLRFDAAKAFIGFINAANSNIVVKAALDEFLAKPNPEVKQSLLTLVNSSHPPTISSYLTILETNNDAKQALRNFLQPQQIQTIPDVFFLNRSENSAILALLFTTKTRVESMTEPGAPDLTQDCRTINNTQISKLANSGNGGITPSPNDIMPSNNIWTENTQTTNTKKSIPTITTAKGWVAGQGRTVILTSQPNGYQPIAITPSRNCYDK
jgi:filamentous hemagglutinin family protein